MASSTTLTSLSIANGSVGTFSLSTLSTQGSPPIRTLRDVDFPVGRRSPRKHPKRFQLSLLIQHHAREYSEAPQANGFHSKEHGRFIRSKTNIITAVIKELMPVNEGGCYMSRSRNGQWAVSAVFKNNPQNMRNLISHAFNAEIKRWGEIDADQSQSSSKFLQDILSDYGVDEQQALHDNVQQQDAPGDGSRASSEVCNKRRRLLYWPFRRPNTPRRMEPMDDVSGSISLTDPSTISSLSGLTPTTVSEDAAHKRGEKAYQNWAPPSLSAALSEPFNSDAEGIVQTPVTIKCMEICMVVCGEESTLGFSAGKSVERLVSDLKNPTLGVTAIKQRLDELTNRTISEDKELMRQDSMRDVLTVVTEVTKKMAGNADVQRKVVSFASPLEDHLGPTNGSFLKGMLRPGYIRVYKLACQLLRRQALDNLRNQLLILDADDVDGTVHSMH